jgi:hypothetical protein
VITKAKLALLGAVVAALATAVPAAAFTPTNAYYAKQWYLASDRAFDAWQAPPSDLAPVKVAIVDSGVDCSLPDFKGRIAATRSFVGGSACNDAIGHGTIVAGEIAGDLGTNGIVGIAYSAQLLVAKVVRSDGTIGLSAEANAIRWAANQGARVINLSLGGVRDPHNPRVDSYSKLEANAVAYANAKGVLVVAAAGNADEANAATWPWADYPAALPHVIGVAALDRSGDVPSFSDFDPRFVDLAAPGVDTFSTFPAALTAQRQGCPLQGYTDCASPDYVHPEGTSFAAPQVSAAAAVLFALQPSLTAAQAGKILERSADDVTPATGCSVCRVGRDSYSGWGRLDVANAIAALAAGALPKPDAHEPNDDVAQAFPLYGVHRSLAATIDYYDDPWDVYRVKLAKGEQLRLRTSAKWPVTKVGLLLWQPGTKTVLNGAKASQRVAASIRSGAVERIVYRATRAGWYYVEVEARRGGGGPYTLTVSKTPAPKAKPKRP